MKKILLGLTTIAKDEWRNKAKEIDELGVKEIALFLTCLEFAERRELYKLLENTGLEKIPHVHLRDDMEIPELDYLTERFNTEVFNVHAEGGTFSFKKDYKDYVKKIFVENSPEYLPSRGDLEKYAGLCLDLSHWESTILDEGLNSRKDAGLKEMASRHRIGVNHVSAIKPKRVHFHDRFTGEDFTGYDFHWLDDLSEVDYVKKYQDYLAEIISIELENPLKRQLEVKNYLEEILDL